MKNQRVQEKLTNILWLNKIKGGGDPTLGIKPQVSQASVLSCNSDRGDSRSPRKSPALLLTLGLIVHLNAQRRWSVAHPCIAVSCWGIVPAVKGGQEQLHAMAKGCQDFVNLHQDVRGGEGGKSHLVESQLLAEVT